MQHFHVEQIYMIVSLQDRKNKNELLGVTNVKHRWVTLGVSDNWWCWSSREVTQWMGRSLTVFIFELCGLESTTLEIPPWVVSWHTNACIKLWKHTRNQYYPATINLGSYITVGRYTVYIWIQWGFLWDKWNQMVWTPSWENLSKIHKG